MKTEPWKVVIEVTLEPGVTADAVVYLDAEGQAGAEVAALETMAYRLRVKSAEVTG